MKKLLFGTHENLKIKKKILIHVRVTSYNIIRQLYGGEEALQGSSSDSSNIDSSGRSSIFSTITAAAVGEGWGQRERIERDDYGEGNRKRYGEKKERLGLSQVRITI